MIIGDIGYYWLVFLAFILGRYFLLAGGTFGILYLISRTRLSKTAWPQYHQWSLIRKDIALSVQSAFLFALIAAVMMLLYQAGYTRIYSSVDDYGWGYLGLSFCLTLILQDAYFYGTHRLLHHPYLFSKMHQGHHQSHVPTPWSSFAFDLGEACIQGCFFVVLVFLLPLHFMTLIAASVTMTIWAILTHLGIQLMPTTRAWHWLGYGLIGPTHHGIHHRCHQVHFGLYFTIWDHLFGTAASTDHKQKGLQKEPQA